MFSWVHQKHFDNLINSWASFSWCIYTLFPLVLIWELERYCQYYVDVRQRCCYYYYYYYKNKYSFEPVVLSYDVVSWSVWKVCSQPLWINKLQWQRQAANVVPCKTSFLWFKVNSCHLKSCAVIVLSFFYFFFF